MKTGKNYIPIDTNEILTFFGINILMGIKLDPNYRDYWSISLDSRDDYLSSLMTVNRFGWLLSSLYLNDSLVMVKRGETDYDKLYKDQPFKKKFKKKFNNITTHIKLLQYLYESMIKFKRR